MQGPIDPPPPHPNLEVRTRAFYGAHNALPVEFWPPCHHGDDAVVQVYEHFGDAVVHAHRLNNIEAEKSTMAERITQLEEELRQERANTLTRRFMPPTVSGRRNYYG